ncbi:MAG: hypothetical protein RJQ21_03785 [Rhodospirillales bacterium]
MFSAAVLSGCLLAASAANAANEFEPQIKSFVETEIAPWLSDATVVDAIKAQNAKNASITEEDISKLDTDWRAQAKAGKGALIDEVLSNALSKFLQAKKEAAGGKIAEMFVMDNKGLNVGQSDVTSDYMQGDEAKWQKTYPAGPGALFIDEIEFDDSSKAFQSQASMTIVDETGAAIGAITIGVNVEKL